jgi:hypothetical protein
MDTTTAVSESGINVVLHKAIALAHKSAGDTQSWGPFFAKYTASVALAGGTATLENAPANKLDLAGVNVSGTIAASVGFDLGQILGELCIPPVRICIDLGWFGEFCIPRFCITWPHIDVGVNLPFAFGLDVSFGFRIDDLGSQWGVVLLIDPFSPRFDLSPMGPAIIGALQAEVTSKLSDIPLLGPLIAGLVNTVLGAFTSVVSLIVGAFGALINSVLMLLDLLNVSIPLTLLAFDKQQTFIPANVPLGGDAPVLLLLSGLAANVRDRELVVEGQLA